MLIKTYLHASILLRLELVSILRREFEEVHDCILAGVGINGVYVATSVDWNSGTDPAVEIQRKDFMDDKH